MAAGMFLFSSIAGLLIKRNLGGLGMFLMLALMGWLFGQFFVWILPVSSGFNQLMNFIGILLFAGLTVWDTQRLKVMSQQLEGKQGMGGMVVIGALALYLDFINCSCCFCAHPEDNQRIIELQQLKDADGGVL